MKASAIKSISYDRYSLVIDGQRTFIRSGAMHYFRLPHQSLWRDRLYKLKAAGYNAVDLYFCWGFHSPAPGVYDFEGIRDVRKLLEMAAELGLYLIARPGPYINAEYTGGGLPGWLIANPDAILRNRMEEDGRFVWSQTYMDYVQEWWNQIIPIIREYPYLLMVQIENEYATLDMEPDYMQALYNMTRDLGITVPLMHNDMYTMGLFEDVVDIYAFDNYSVTQFDTDWRAMEGVFSVIDNIENSLRPFCQNRPLMVAELQAGWFGTWKGYPYEKIVEHLGREHISIVTKSLIGQGLTIFNHYKAIGGTNWDYIGSTDTYTSYDFGAPISEAGVNTERLFEAKAINMLLSSFDLSATEREEAPPISVSHPEYLYAVRRTVGEDSADTGERWLFLRNLTERPTELTLGESLQVQLQPHEIVMLPHQVSLKCGYTLLHSNVEPVFQSKECLVLKGGRPVEVLLETDGVVAIHGEPSEIQCQALDVGRYRLTCQNADPRGICEIQVGSLKVFVLGPEWVDTLWLQEDGALVMGPEERILGDQYGVLNPEREIFVIAPHGTMAREEGLSEEPEPLDLPELKHWNVFHEAPELFSDKGFYPVSPEGADYDTNGLYEGSAWYRFRFENGDAKEVLVDARHIWALFLNGTFVAQGHHWNSVHEAEHQGPQRVMLPPHLLNEQGANDLVIFVDGLGHPKGFHDDARQPQGLLLLKLDEVDVTRSVMISDGFCCWKDPIRQVLHMMPQMSPVVRLETRFTMPPMTGLDCPMGIYLNHLDYERVNIYLNGMLVGRHWRECQRQKNYYLPGGVLKPYAEGENTLELILINFQPLIPLTECTPGLNDVYLQPYEVFTKITL